MNKLYAHLSIMNKEDAEAGILEIVRQNPEGATVDDILEQIHMDINHLNEIIAEMVKNGILQIRDGRYYVTISQPMDGITGYGKSECRSCF